MLDSSTNPEGADAPGFLRRACGAWLILGMMLATPATAAVYYVDTNHPAASNNNPGTESLPYKTISGAVDVRGGPGTTVLVKPGVYPEKVTVSASGTAASPFVIQAVGPGVIVEGADDFSTPGQWAPYSGNVFVASSVNWNPSQVFVDGVRLTPFGGSPNATPVNRFTYTSSGGLFLNVGGGSPGNRTTLVGRRTHGFRLAGRSYVTIDGFTVTHSEDRGIYLSNSSNFCILRGNTVIWSFRYGIQLSSSTGGLVETNMVSDNQDHGIALVGNTTGVTVQDNESFRNARPDTRAANGLYLNRSTNNVLQRNRLHDNQDSGSNLTSSSDDNVQIQTLSWNNGDHGFDHLASKNSTIIGCVAYGNVNDGFSIEGSSTGLRLYNSIAVNNGLTTGEYNLWVDSQSSLGFQSDYNLFWNSNGQAGVRFISTTYSTVAAFNATTGNEAHGLQANPQFVNPAAGDFHLQQTSPAIDAAKSDAPNWPAADAEGHTRQDLPMVPNSGTGPVLYAERGALEFFIATNVPPVVTASGTASVNENQLLTVNVSAVDPNGDPITSLTATPLPPGATFTPGPDNSTGTLTWTPSYSQNGLYSVTFTATNSLSGSATTAITVNNTDRAPVVTAPAAGSVNENQLLTVNVSVSDPDGEAIASLTASPLPPGASFAPSADHTTGTLTWTPGYSQGGSYSVTFTATNAISGNATTTITVSNVDRPPAVTAPASASVAENQLLTVNVSAGDPDGEAIVSLTAAPLPPGASFTSSADHTTGTLTWTPAYDQSGPYSISFTATNTLTGSGTTAVTIVNVDRAPAVTAPASATVRVGELLTVAVTASDPDGEAIAILSMSGLPAAASFTPAEGNTTGTLTWTPAEGDIGAHTATFTAANALPGSASTSITVQPADQAPAVTAPASASIDESQLLTVNVSVTDPNGDPITSLTATPLPPGATFSAGAGNTTGTLTWTPTYSQSGPYSVTFTATNALSGSATTAITVHNVDRAPVVTAPATAVLLEGETLVLDVSASDPDGDAITSLDAAPLPPGASFTPGPGNSSGTLNWPTTLGSTGTYPVTFTAANLASGSSTTAITVTQDHNPPVVVAPANVQIRALQTLTLQITAGDPDGQPIGSLTATEKPAGASFTPGPGNTTGTLTWTPGVGDIGPHGAMFTATNTQTGSASTSITVVPPDQAPAVAAPATASVDENQQLTVNVSASDPENDPITSLTAAPLPPGATFTPGAGNTTGTLTWTPNYSQSGPFSITFTATNAMSGSATSAITVHNVDRTPAVSAPGSASVSENQLLTVTVSVSDPDGDSIGSLTAAPLPAGATFTPGAGNTTGTLTWTPDYSQSGPFSVTFTATNALSASASTAITVNNADRAPAVTAPANVTVTENQPLTINVSAVDPDGDSIGSLTAAPLPAGATFTTGAGNTTGVLTWTPTAADVGNHVVTFAADNALSGSASTTITVQLSNQPPVAALTVTPATGNAPLLVTANASGSTDSDGVVASYTFNFGDGTVVGPQSTAVASHPLAAGTWTVSVTVIDDDGASHSTSLGVVVAAVPPQPNLVGNPSFETNLNGWNASGTATLVRVAGGFDGAWALQMTGSSSPSTFGCNDSPNWVLSAPAAGQRYRVSAWVRSASNTGSARIQVREYQGSTKLGTAFSPHVGLSPQWQLVTVDYITVAAGTTLDVQVQDTPLVGSEVFLVDNISIRNVTGSEGALMAEAGAPEMGLAGGAAGEMTAAGDQPPPLKPTLSPNPLRSRGTLVFATSRVGALQIALYDIGGRRVRDLHRRDDAPAGLYRIPVDGRDDEGRPLPPGMYFYRIQATEGSTAGRFVISR